jgi:O-antigen ligase
MFQSQLTPANKRLITAKICLRMLPDAGWHGFGPGTFALVFPHYTGQDASLIPGIWRYAHNDYLQTLLEWGWMGAILWAIVLFGALAQLVHYWRKRRDLSTSDRVLCFMTMLALSGVAAHAMVDFPFQIMSLQLYAGVCVGFGWGCGRWEGTLAHRS